MADVRGAPVGDTSSCSCPPTAHPGCSEPIELLSVTSLLREALGTSRQLVSWAVTTTAEAAYDRFAMLRQFVEDGDREGAIKWLCDQRFAKTGAAAARGSDVHRVAEQLHLGAAVSYDAAIEPYVRQYRRFLEEFAPKFELAEAPVYNLTYRYAGTLDGIARIDGQRVVLDIKTTAHGPDSGRSRPPYPEVALQLVLYRHAELVGLVADRREVSYRRYYRLSPDAPTEPMPETDGAVCIVVSPEDYLVVPVDTSERVWRAARHVIQVARWQTELASAVLGTPLIPPQRSP